MSQKRIADLMKPSLKNCLEKSQKRQKLTKKCLKSQNLSPTAPKKLSQKCLTKLTRFSKAATETFQKSFWKYHKPDRNQSKNWRQFASKVFSTIFRKEFDFLLTPNWARRKNFRYSDFARQIPQRPTKAWQLNNLFARKTAHFGTFVDF